jgi:Tol biopolymer transport system component/DNA-binding winged helix-turn-helix (wHTH) protein
MLHPTRSPVIQFGAFEVDPRAGELRKNGFRVKIQQQPFAVLMALLERPGEVVSREELRTRLWPHDTFVDFEHSLNAAVKRLRGALGESAERPVFIETLAKRGYRFIGSLNDYHPRLPVLVPSPVTAAEKPRRAQLALLIAAMVVFFLALGAVLFLRLSRPPRPTASADHLEARLTANSAENPVTGAAISPDGNYLAYSDSTGLYLKLIRSGETHPIRLPKDFLVMPVSWFPDGAHLLLSGTAKPDGEPGLWSISIHGGAPRKLVDTALSGAVSPDGQRVAFLRGTTDWGDDGTEIWIVNSDGTNPWQLLRAPSGEIGKIAWAPDSKRVAYTRSPRAGSPTIEISPLKGPVGHTLLSHDKLGPALLWLPDGRLIYSLQEERPNQRDSNAWAIRIDPHQNPVGAPARLTRSPGWISAITSSSDGKHLALLKDAWTSDVLLGRLTPDQGRIRNLRRMTLEESIDLPTSWTADSKAVLFSSDRNGHQEIFKQAVDQTQPELLVVSAEHALLPRLSPDGSEVLYMSFAQNAPPSSNASVLAAPVNGGVPRKLLEIERLGMGNLECAREPANFCVVHSNDGKRVRFFRFDPRTGSKSELTEIENEGMVNWGLSPNGSYLAIVPHASDGNSLTLYTMADGKMRKLEVKGWTGLATLDWAADSKSMFIGTLSRSGRISLLRVTLQGSVRVLREGKFPPVCACAYWAIPSPDGKWVAINQPTGSSNVWELDRN